MSAEHPSLQGLLAAQAATAEPLPGYSSFPDGQGGFTCGLTVEIGELSVPADVLAAAGGSIPPDVVLSVVAGRLTSGVAAESPSASQETSPPQGYAAELAAMSWNQLLAPVLDSMSLEQGKGHRAVGAAFCLNSLITDSPYEGMEGALGAEGERHRMAVFEVLSRILAERFGITVERPTDLLGASSEEADGQ